VYRPLRTAIDRLEGALGRLRLTSEIVERTTEAIVITDSNATILHVNRSFSDITGYGPEEAVGRRTSLLKSGLHDRAFYEDMWASLLAAGEWQGEIWNRKKSGEIYLESLSITRIVGPDSRVHFVAIFTQAHHDRLTGLANRHLFMSRLTSALRAPDAGAVAVVFIDLDGFKAVNDTHGHDHGDRLLQAVGRALKRAAGASAVAARMGGDEFAILLPAVAGADDAMRVAEAALAGIRDVALGAPQWAGVAASLGVVVAEPADRAEPLPLLKSADEAMYAAKRQGKDRVVIGRYAPAHAHDGERGIH
jgi:diguanylate cyclase (GGDEF)-like protein/PAS domain S-box-containing protein